MSSLSGADLEAMDQLSSLLKRKSQQLSALRSTSGSQISQLPRLWDGPDAGQFVQQWNGRHSPALRAAVQALDDASATITRNRQAQDETSATLLGATAGGGDGGGDGDGGGGRFGFVSDAWGWTTDTASDGWDWTSDTASDGWDWTSDTASDAWDWTSDTASDGWDWTTDTASDAWDWTGDTASDAWDWTSDTATDAWETAAPVVAEGGHRFSELGEYAAARAERRFRNPVQTIIDDLTLTSPLEVIAATDLILRGGGEFEDSVGNGEFEAITDVNPYGAGGITLGHTVGFKREEPDPFLVAHELQHVYDIESVGGANFYGSYLAHWGINIARGQDPSLLGEAYRNIYWEQRGYAVEDGLAEPEHLRFDLNPLRWFD